MTPRAGRFALGAGTVSLAALAMSAFAANSVLARLALGDGQAGAGAFTLVRIASGALVLAVLASRRARPRAWLATGSWTSAAMLVGYATAFSYAYLRLGAGTGALVLFGAVQTVIFTAAIRAGERPSWSAWLGLALAGVGMVALAAPSAQAPDRLGLVLMVLAGVAWAVYTLRGRASTRPLDATAANFALGVPLALALVVPLLVLNPGDGHLSAAGALLAVLSGAVASGLGYAVWYLVLPRLTRVQSGLVQLTPAPMAMVGGLLLLSEPITGQVLVASVLILGGVALGVTGRAGPTRDAGRP